MSKTLVFDIYQIGKKYYLLDRRFAPEHQSVLIKRNAGLYQVNKYLKVYNIKTLYLGLQYYSKGFFKRLEYCEVGGNIKNVYQNYLKVSEQWELKEGEVFEFLPTLFINMYVEEARVKIKEKATGRILTEETKNKIRDKAIERYKK